MESVGTRRSKKPKRRTLGAAAQHTPATEEYVKVVPLQPTDDHTQPIQISKARRAKTVKVLPDGLSVTSTGGYRSVQSSRGTHCGTWFFEVHVTHLGPTGHCRLGIGTYRQEVEAPCGYTDASFGYRDVDGSKVSKSWREPYSAPYKEGDVIGVWLHLPEGGRVMETKSEIVRWKGKLYQTAPQPDDPAKELLGSALGYTVNGAWQGIAFKDILEGTYYAAASLFTRSKQAEHRPACVTFNFGPNFKFSPPRPEGYPEAKPFSDLQAPEPDANPRAIANGATVIGAEVASNMDGTGQTDSMDVDFIKSEGDSLMVTN